MMKRLLCICAVMAAALFATAPGASAQFKIGPKVGMCVNSLHFNNDLFDSSNRAGFTAGAMAEFTVPVIGVGCDLSVLYVRRNSRWIYEYEQEIGTTNVKGDYIDIPLNFKYKISIPVVANIIRPFVTTGPDFAFLTSKKTVQNIIKCKSFDFSWNFGIGLELVNHLQIAASYGIGLNKAMESITNVEGASISGKNRYWTVTAAYLF